MHGNHGELDEVGRGALHGGVDGGALGALAALAVGAVDFRYPQSAPKQRFDVALTLGSFARVLHVFAHAGVACKIALYIGLRGGAFDIEVLRQSERRHAVNQAEVDDLSIAALLAVDGFALHSENFGCGGTVDILACGKGFEQSLICLLYTSPSPRDG